MEDASGRMVQWRLDQLKIEFDIEHEACITHQVGVAHLRLLKNEHNEANLDDVLPKLSLMSVQKSNDVKCHDM